jgi:hypothetical protein
VKYPGEFPPDARARVESEKLRVYAMLEQDVQGLARGRRDLLFIGSVMRVFLAFAREACASGRSCDPPAWSDSELDQTCREFLLSIVIEAWEDKARYLGVRQMFRSTHHWGYSLDEDAKRRIAASPEWKEYQNLLLGALEFQSTRSDPEEPSGGVPKGGTSLEDERTAPDPGTNGPQIGDRQPFRDEASSKRERWSAVVNPILKAKDWTVNKWATVAGVGKNCAYDYLDGRRNLSKANRRALAEVIGLRVQDLPD